MVPLSDPTEAYERQGEQGAEFEANINRLEELNRQKGRGDISDEEFNRQREELMQKLGIGSYYNALSPREAAGPQRTGQN